jgi:acetyl esterase/lipase
MAQIPALSYDPKQTYQLEVKEVEYRRDENQSWPVRVYQPQGSGPFPVMVDAHGGAWNRGTRTNAEVMDRALAESGIVVAAFEFRLAPDHPYPAQVTDINYGTRWLKAHAGDFNGDAGSIGALGSSSGGHTVFLSAMRPLDHRYAALTLDEAPELDATLDYIVACWPVVDPFARYLYAQETNNDRLVASTNNYFTNSDGTTEGNPHMILQRGEKVTLPPALIIQGTEDDNIPVPATKEFAAAYRRSGGDIQLEIFDGMPHGFGYQAGPETDRAVGLIKAFIARQLS